LFLLQNLQLEYEPFPIGIASPVFEDSLYRELLNTYPPVEIFRHVPQYGEKYSLSEKNNRPVYEQYVSRYPAWREFRRYVKSRDFVFSIIDALRQRGIDLRLTRKNQSLGRRWLKLLGNVAQGRMPVTDPPIYSRFEFSMLPANGGIVTPHTDAPRKFITLVVAMVGEDEWKDEYGGGTEMLKPRDIAKSYNYYNRSLPYDECETLKAFPFKPNQAVFFVKTFNSLHGVRELRGPAGTWRRTLTINIERGY
jgi:hypothetical protein